MAKRIDIADANNERLDILRELYTRNTTVPQAANALALISLSTNLGELEDGLGITWMTIMVSAREQPEHQRKLVDILVCLAQLPDAQDERGEPLVIYGMRVWSDLPMLAWDFNYEWNALNNPKEPGPERADVISRFVNINRFTARLMATDLPVFHSFSMFAIWTLRKLEQRKAPPGSEDPLDALEVFVPAAAAWISVVGDQMYWWDEEFGRAGRGGPLWGDQKHGFCEERWKLWRKRFGEIADVKDGVSEHLKTVAKYAEKRMLEIEEEAKEDDDDDDEDDDEQEAEKGNVRQGEAAAKETEEAAQKDHSTRKHEI